LECPSCVAQIEELRSRQLSSRLGHKAQDCGSLATRGVAEDRAAGQIAATRYQPLISDRAKAEADLDSMMSEMRGGMKGIKVERSSLLDHNLRFTRHLITSASPVPRDNQA
jgi:hypothetical protein